jgi:hypothetical protein
MPKNRTPLSIQRLLKSTGDRRVNAQPPVSGSVPADAQGRGHRQTARILSFLEQPSYLGGGGLQQLPPATATVNATYRRFGEGKPRPRAPGLM